ncbi:uncharacterized protein BT62DRAFT_917667 [Guyanagaster necrorhizus]|uniref:DUF2423 domain-containing protein n=1 Tax=Guyanagaster necrorhizus TaxID=856835 RepID=A0A9P7VXE1_9AGAR|nr:uncharacterized protein BT62DRAFT_917667 [Guyanagaster necrorhizus MCA 3950]KAG7448993.1 hypothetical protein BT62DRAFT_917667 [Guyanagaster necrorhizus MCA 3950]
MAKSLRSKSKRNFRSKKREDGIYAATEAARLHRLNAKLMAVVSKDNDGDVPLADAEGEVEDSTGWSSPWLATFGLLDAMDITADTMHSLQHGSAVRLPRRRRARKADMQDNYNPLQEPMEVDTLGAVATRISTHGRRGSRREEWRLSKGLSSRPKSKGMNRQGGLAAVRRPGRSKRRR